MGYYRNYRRPYYRRGNYYSNRRPTNPLEGFSEFIAVLTIIILIWSVWRIGIRDFLIILLFFGIPILGIVVLFRKIRFKKSNRTHINSEKHGCKCYMEGLSDAEKDVASILSEKLDYKNYFLFNNLIIPSDYNGSTQIDHIIISKFGVFVIESKNLSGWIFGSRDEDFWTQSLAGGNSRFQFQNPTRQNYAHIMALKALMPSIGDNFFNIVVFSGESEIKTPRMENVLYLKELVQYIERFTQEKLSENDVHLAIGKLSYVCQTTDISSTDHIENLHNAHQQ